MKAAVIYREKDVRIEDIQVPEVTPGKAIVEVAWTGICGSDLHAYSHGSGIPIKEAHPFTGKKAPLTLGHEFAGTVTEIGEGVTNVAVGDKVAVEPILYCGECDYCKEGKYNLCEKANTAFIGLTTDGGFADYVVTDAFRFHKLPENMTLEEGALVEPTAVAYHAVKKSRLSAGQTTAIFGAGPIGLLTLLSAQASGATDTFIVDISQERLDKAKELGATHCINPMNEDAVEKIMTVTDGKGVDVSFECAGAQPTFASALTSVKRGGTILVVSAFAKDVSFNPSSLLVKEATLDFSIAYANDFPNVINLIAKGKLDVKQIITKKIKLDNLVKDGLELSLEDKSQAKILVSPR